MPGPVPGWLPGVLFACVLSAAAVWLVLMGAGWLVRRLRDQPRRAWGGVLRSGELPPGVTVRPLHEVVVAQTAEQIVADEWARVIAEK